MNIYQDNDNNEIFLREDEIDVVVELKDRLGITIKPMGKNGTYSEKQSEYLGAIKEWILDDYWTKWTPQELYDNEMDNVMEELGITYSTYYCE